MEADYLRFFGIENYEEMESAKFFRLAVRVFAYDGVMAARLSKLQEEGKLNSSDYERVTPTNDAEELKNLRQRGAQVSKVTSNERSYLYDLLKEG